MSLPLNRVLYASHTYPSICACIYGISQSGMRGFTKDTRDESFSEKRQWYAVNTIAVCGRALLGTIYILMALEVSIVPFHERLDYQKIQWRFIRRQKKYREVLTLLADRI